MVWSAQLLTTTANPDLTRIAEERIRHDIESDFASDQQDGSLTQGLWAPVGHIKFVKPMHESSVPTVSY